MSRHPHDLLSLAVDGRLDALRAARLDTHLTGCDACRALLVTMRETREDLLATPVARMPGTVRLPAAGPDAAPRPRWLVWAGSGGLVAAAAAVVLVAVLVRHGVVEAPTTAGSGAVTAPPALAALPGRPGERLALGLQPAAPGVSVTVAVDITAFAGAADVGATGRAAVAAPAAGAAAVRPQASAISSEVAVTFLVVDATQPGLVIGRALPPGLQSLGTAATTAAPGAPGRLTLTLPPGRSASTLVVVATTPDAGDGTPVVVAILPVPVPISSAVSTGG